LDYDGTLREFEPQPEDAVPTPEIMELLTRLNEAEDLVPHIISGRDTGFLETHFGALSRFTLVAERGYQIRRPYVADSLGGGWELCDLSGGGQDGEVLAEVWRAAVRGEIAASVAAAVPGSRIEEKASSLVWHYRAATTEETYAEAMALNLLERLELLRSSKCWDQLLQISPGDKMVEVSCRTGRKGPVMRRLCEEKSLFGEPFAAVLVAGDDRSDESMFDIAPQDFLTIKVGSAVTHARFRVDSPGHLRDFLWQLLSARGGDETDVF
jgi:trehalose 6-phosphate synthase/phosphatase